MSRRLAHGPLRYERQVCERTEVYLFIYTGLRAHGSATLISNPSYKLHLLWSDVAVSGSVFESWGVRVVLP